MSRKKSQWIFVYADAETSSKYEARYLLRRMKEDGAVTLGGATGRTQVEVYRQLFLLLKPLVEHEFPLSKAEIFFLDEYFGAAPLYHAYARQHLRAGQRLGFRADNIWVPRGCFFTSASTGGKLVDSDMLDRILKQTKGEWEERTEPGEDGNPPEIYIRPEASHPVLREIRQSNRAFDERVRTSGAARIALLGLGTSGHIGFVERGAAPAANGDIAGSGVMLVRLSPSTLDANAADFSLTNGDGAVVELERPRYAITQGIGTILSAGELVLAAHGAKKYNAVRRMLLEEPGPQNPAGFVQRHHTLRVFLDREALGEIHPQELQDRGFEVEVRIEEAVSAAR
jgi:6-phosphogluconolactonase/glucosamine-6-phosphate isomerase/deaminase